MYSLGSFSLAEMGREPTVRTGLSYLSLGDRSQLTTCDFESLGIRQKSWSWHAGITPAQKANLRVTRNFVDYDPKS